MKESYRELLKIVFPFCCAFAFARVMFAQRPFREYPSVEYGESTPLPPDWQRSGEWAFARLMYPPGPNDGYRGRSMAIGVKACRCGPRMDRPLTAILPRLSGDSLASTRDLWNRT